MSEKRRDKRNIRLNRSWFIYYGRKLGMCKREVLVTPYGEMLDMLACSYIDAGTKQKKRKLTQEQMFFDVI